MATLPPLDNGCHLDGSFPFRLRQPETALDATCCYCPAAGAVITNGRLNSISSSVPAGSMAELCLLNQCATVAVAPTTPPTSTPLPPPINPPTIMPPPVPNPTSAMSLPV